MFNVTVMQPISIRFNRNKNIKYIIAGHTNQGESGDFILEAQNRRIKRWMPPGVPNEERWKRVCRNIDRLDKVFIYI